MHELDLAPEYVPALHDKQDASDCAPVSLEKELPGHDKQFEAPDAD